VLLWVSGTLITCAFAKGSTYLMTVNFLATNTGYFPKERTGYRWSEVSDPNVSDFGADQKYLVENNFGLAVRMRGRHQPASPCRDHQSFDSSIYARDMQYGSLCSLLHWRLARRSTQRGILR
jgi:hypothetical protein